MNRKVLKTFDLDPDRVRVVVNWDNMKPNTSVFIPCINTEKAIEQLNKIIKKKKWEAKTHVRIEDAKLGVRIWRVS
jgi:DNA gyrase/topoisomerase IV subunit A